MNCFRLKKACFHGFSGENREKHAKNAKNVTLKNAAFFQFKKNLQKNKKNFKKCLKTLDKGGNFVIIYRGCRE